MASTQRKAQDTGALGVLTLEPHIRKAAYVSEGSDQSEIEERPIPEQSEPALKNWSHVRAIAIEIWGDSRDADRWLKSPHPELHGATPLSLLETKRGTHQVEVLLSALDNGFPV